MRRVMMVRAVTRERMSVMTEAVSHVGLRERVSVWVAVSVWVLLSWVWVVWAVVWAVTAWLFAVVVWILLC